MSSVQNMLSKRFDQICFVVEDLQQAMDFFSKTNGVEVWNVAEGLSQTQKEKEYYGQPGDFQFSCAYGFTGETLIELARHDGGQSVYKDWLDEKGKGPHHIGFRQKDAAEYAQAEQHYLDLGIQKAMAGFLKDRLATAAGHILILASKLAALPNCTMLMVNLINVCLSSKVAKTSASQIKSLWYQP